MKKWPKEAVETSPKDGIPDKIPFKEGKISLPPEMVKKFILKNLNKAQKAFNIETHLTKKELAILSLKWGFLRKNKDYQKSYAKLQEEYGTSNIFEFEMCYYFLTKGCTKSYKKAIGFSSRWDLHILIDPYKLFKNFSKYELAVFSRGFVVSEIPRVLDHEELFKKAFSAAFSVNLWAPKKILLRQFEREVDICKKLLEPIMKQKKLSYKDTRLRIQDYKEYLKVKNKVKSPSDIKKLAEKRCGKKKEDKDVTQEVSYNERFYKRQLGRANEIIKEGGRQISL